MNGDPVDRPDHYTIGGIETVDFIVAKELNYLLGNVVKYVSRAPYKGRMLEDLKKAARYLKIQIFLLELEEKEKEAAIAARESVSIDKQMNSFNGDNNAI